MRIDAAAISARHAEASKQRKREQLPDLRIVAQAKVAGSMLTNSPEWDGFLRVCEALAEAADKEVAGWKSRFADDPFIDPNVLVSFKVFAAAATARAGAIRDVMELPKRMKVAGEAAEDIIADVVGDGPG